MADRKAGASTQALLQLDAATLRDRLAMGALRATELAEACLQRIAAREPEIGAWAWLDGDNVLEQARRLDQLRQSGAPIGPLHGLPVGIKDIVDTARIPTENGTAIDKGRVPARDAWIVERLKAAGAVIMGKTVTTELAVMTPGRTRNPRNPAHTPGGSSSGSVAAVADLQVPLSVGTQTVGSVIRPAAFCGITGFKPSFGAIPRTGVLVQSPTLDTIGTFARRPEDAALLADVLFGHDSADRATDPRPFPRLFETASSAPPVTPVLAFVRPPGWDDADPRMREAMEELVEALGEQCFEVELPPAFQEAAAQRLRIHLAEMAKCYHAYVRRGRDQLSPALLEQIERGDRIPARDYIAALDWRDVLNAGIDEILFRADAILSPAAPGPAPAGLESTGDPIFNGLWSLCGTPAVTVPVFETEDGLPMGAQLTGRRGDDGRLLRTAAWLMRRVTELG